MNEPNLPMNASNWDAEIHIVPAEPKPPRTFRSHDTVAALLAFVAAFLLVRFVLYGISFWSTVVLMLLAVGCYAYVRCNGCRPQGMQHVTGIIMLLFPLVFSLTSGSGLRGLCLVFQILATAWWLRSVSQKTGFVTRFFLPDLLAACVKLPMEEYAAGVEVLRTAPKNARVARSVATIGLGLLGTIPLTFLVGALLASADAGVEQWLERLLDADLGRLLWQLILSVPIGLWLYALLYGISNGRLCSDAEYETAMQKCRVFPALGLYAALIPIFVLYFVYVISQIQYYCAAFVGELPETMSFADYARRGFFELCVLAVINLGLILVLTGCSKRESDKRPIALRLFATVLCLLTLFLIATALAKMGMYIDAYGLTRLRLYTAWFMVLLAICFVVLLVRQYVTRIPTAAILATAFLVGFLGLCAVRPDALIASYNISRYEDGTLKELDVDMLCDLSSDAYVVMAEHWDTVCEVDSDNWQGNFVERVKAEERTLPDLRLQAYVDRLEETYAEQLHNE